MPPPKTPSLVPAIEVISQSAGLSIEQPHVQFLSGELLDEVIRSYVHYYASGETHTARAKRYDLDHFVRFLSSFNPPGKPLLVSDWTLQRTKDFVDQRLALGEAPATVARRLATIKHFGRTLAERVPGYINPAREAKSPIVNLTRPQGLTIEEISALQQAALESRCGEDKDFSDVRNAFVVELLLATGLRADEIRMLVMSQVSDDNRWLKNVKTKGKRFRNVYLDTEVRNLVTSYLEARAEELSARFPGIETLERDVLRRYPVLISFYKAVPGDPASFGVSPKTIWNAVAKVGAKAQALFPEQMGRLHPHRLRHAFAHGLLDSSKDIRLVAQALGHSDVRTTMRYTERTEDEIAHAIESRIAARSQSERE